MSFHKRFRRCFAGFTVVGLTAAAVDSTGVFAGVGAAAARPMTPLSPAASRSTDNTANVTAVRRQVIGLYQEAEQDTQEFDATEEQIARLEASTADITGREEQLRALTADARLQVGRDAAAEYRDLGMDPTLVLFSSENPQAYLDRAGLLHHLAIDEQAQLKALLKESAAEDQLEQDTHRALADLHSEEAGLTAWRAKIQAELSTAQQRLDSLAGADRSQAVAGVEAVDGLGVGFAGAPELASLLASIDDGSPDAGRAARAVASAYAELGKPYVWGAIGPEEFDCSGLTRYVWAAAGVWLPRTSQEQSAAGTVVPVSLISPGDLVIYFSGRTHVGIYVGQGLIIHAPRPGSFVQFARLHSMPISLVIRPF